MSTPMRVISEAIHAGSGPSPLRGSHAERPATTEGGTDGDHESRTSAWGCATAVDVLVFILLVVVIVKAGEPPLSISRFLGARGNKPRQRRSCRRRMWYKSRPMVRRGTSVMLLLLLAMPLLATVAFASDCLELCGDDTKDASCPPVCSLCNSCTRAQAAIVQHAVTTLRRVTTEDAVSRELAAADSAVADEILHIPLLG